METQLKRMIICTKDIQLITGTSERTSRALLAKAKKHYNKAKHQLLSIKEFCKYFGINDDDIDKFIR